jgi:hypothetical protein
MQPIDTTICATSNENARAVGHTIRRRFNLTSQPICGVISAPIARLQRCADR